MGVEADVAEITPVRKAITVQRPVETVFEIFTARIGRWWPMSTHSLSEARAVDVVIEPRLGGGVYEVRDDGERISWGRVLAWEPPGRLVVSWHPGMDPAVAQEVEVRFVPVKEGTRVELEHRGWAKLGEAARATRDGYDNGWVTVFGKNFADACS